MHIMKNAHVTDRVLSTTHLFDPLHACPHVHFNLHTCLQTFNIFTESTQVELGDQILFPTLQMKN